MAAWVKGPAKADEPFPSKAYPACFMENANIAYVARAKVEGMLVSGFTTRSGLKAYCPYDGKEYHVTDYEIMVTDAPESFYWEKGENGEIPPNAVQSGEDGSGKGYVGRSCTPYSDARYVYHTTPLPARYIPAAARLGKVHPAMGCLYVSYEGVEYNFTQYEVLCHK